ncbi:hypothetical protein LTR65_004437 [Meristemomyces frigidus]
MSNKKRGNGRVTTSAANRSRGSDANSSSFTMSRSSAPKVSKARKPTQEWVEVSSDEEENEAPAPKRGVLRGLNPNNVLAAPLTQASVEILDSDDNDDGDNENDGKPTQQPAHGTRASRYGKAPVDYDMKYHPMDEVTRPKRAANRRSGSRSKSVSMKRHLDDDTGDESEPSTARDEDGDEEGASEDEDDSAAENHVNPTRAPDPRASRHSARSEAQKAVNYSRKSHPQDYGLPGFQHKAKRSHDPSIPAPYKTAYKRKSTTEDDDEDDIDEAQPAKVPLRARKNLKSLSSSSPTAVKAKAKPGKSRKKQKTQAGLGTFGTDELAGFVEELCKDAPAARNLAGCGHDAEYVDDHHLFNEIMDRSTPAGFDAANVIGSLCDDLLVDPTYKHDSSPTATARADVDDAFEDSCAVEQGTLNTAIANLRASEITAVGPKVQCPQAHNAQPPLTPTSEDRLIIVRPYYTGHEPTTLDLRSLAPGMLQRTSAVAVHMPTFSPIGHSFSSSQDLASGQYLPC